MYYIIITQFFSGRLTVTPNVHISDYPMRGRDCFLSLVNSKCYHSYALSSDLQKTVFKGSAQSDLSGG